MHGLARIFFVLTLVVWLGEVLFLSFAVAPTMFRSFSTAEAGRVMSALFPVYYRVGYVAGVILLLAAVLLRSASTTQGLWTFVALVVAVMLAATVYAGAVLQPRTLALRERLHSPETPQSVKSEFDVLHRRAVQLNSIVLIGGVLVAIVLASRVRP